jgi:CBS-domain-containing membrane protein
VKRIKDLRTRAVGTQGIQQGATIEEAVHMSLDRDISALVVFDGERLSGIFTKNDLVRCCARDPQGVLDFEVEDHSSEPFIRSEHPSHSRSRRIRRDDRIRGKEESQADGERRLRRKVLCLHQLL